VGDHLSADRHGDGEPVSGTGDKSGISIEVEIAVDAKGTGGRMSAGKFAEGKRDRPADEGGEDEAEDHGGTGQFDGGGGTEEQSRPDRAADSDHGHLSGGELTSQAGLGTVGFVIADFYVLHFTFFNESGIRGFSRDRSRIPEAPFEREKFGGRRADES